ncbi:transporter substrate-binding domain-containing protein [Zooshikella marina]|uniref:substrate-binding periplasmic protein n=1 Tax=Zooshikella ganghwensis TaxID=202772 RepID=UPI001BAEFAB4|nr:transporter substrate-binding domain-containing protein [Zooshikella ganghwensis]MBU2705370.1 transporter substrate-binding domain-containing protein [Zooshikella ganghwensis]
MMIKRLLTRLLNYMPLIYVTGLVPLSSYAVEYKLFTEELPPYSFKKGKELKGVSIDIVSMLFNKASLPYELKIVPLRRAFNMAKTQKYNCVFPVQRTQAREALFQWVSPTLITKTGFYTMEDSPHTIKTIDDVKKMEIGSYSGSAVVDYLEKLGYTIRLTSKEENNVHKLANKRIDVWAADTITSSYYAKKNNVKLKEQLVYLTTLRALACNLETPIEDIEKLQSVLKSMYADGSISKIQSQYH